ncbi:MAG TPA: triose-phosphate isomerase, partial [Terrimesophilobacter sp.]|nr:triose-phosphate isomerase [Terrimesophilobacter sp.]
EQVAAALRGVLVEAIGSEVAGSTRILYGGSVKSGNIAGFMRMPNLDGALVGGASLDIAEFSSIVQYRKHVGV